MHIILAKALLEMLYKIGLPQEYNYKIVENAKNEIKEIKKQNKALFKETAEEEIIVVLDIKNINQDLQI